MVRNLRMVVNHGDVVRPYAIGCEGVGGPDRRSGKSRESESRELLTSPGFVFKDEVPSHYYTLYSALNGNEDLHGFQVACLQSRSRNDLDPSLECTPEPLDQVFQEPLPDIELVCGTGIESGFDGIFRSSKKQQLHGPRTDLRIDFGGSVSTQIEMRDCIIEIATSSSD